MFPDGWPALAGFWCGAAVVLAGYLVLFLLARRPVTLRLRRLGCIALVVAGLRLMLILFGELLAAPVDIGLTGFALLSGIGLWLGARIWLARTDAETLREQIQMACQGLFLECAEPQTGLFLLTAKGSAWRLRMLGLSRRVQLVVLPRVAGTGKVALLLQWLSKQYPGPVPRLHIVLKKE